MPDVREISADELAGIVSDGLEAADVTRARGLTDLLDARLARLEGLRRELDLRRAVDDTDPFLATLQERLVTTELTARALDVEALRAVTPPAEASENEATVSGRVILPAGGVPEDARARLRDKGGNLVRGVESRLDAGGAFTLKLPVAAKGTDPKAEYTVVVVDSNDREIARDERKVLPAKGTVEYRELPLKASRVAEVLAASGASSGATGAGSAGPAPAAPATAAGRGSRATTTPKATSVRRTTGADLKPAGRAVGTKPSAGAPPAAGGVTPARTPATAAGATTVGRAAASRASAAKPKRTSGVSRTGATSGATRKPAASAGTPKPRGGAAATRPKAGRTTPTTRPGATPARPAAGSATPTPKPPSSTSRATVRRAGATRPSNSATRSTRTRRRTPPT